MEKSLKAKKIVNIVVNAILWLFVVFCLVVTIIAVSANDNAKNVPTLAGKCFLYVQSDSMNAEKPAGVPENKPSGFAKGAMIIGKYIVDDDKAIDSLEVGDVITYEWDITGDGSISPGENNTHRITNINRNEAGAVISVETMGDNSEFSHGVSETVRRDAIISVYTGTKFPGLGSALAFLNSRLGFGLCILLPLVAFFVYQLVKFIQAVMTVKNNGKKVISAADEELIKQKAVEEYLRLMKEKAAGENKEGADKEASGNTDNADNTNNS